MVLIGLLVAVVALIAIVWSIEPKRVGVLFTQIPPVIARVNTPRRDASLVRRLIILPTGDTYTIPQGSRGHFILVFDWQVRVKVDGQRRTLAIPKLTTTDFASIPRMLHTFISPLTNTIYAAILHDYLYRHPEDAVAAALDRLTVDQIFYWGMRARGVKRPIAGIMYLGVRLGGKSSYKRAPTSTSLAQPLHPHPGDSL